MIRIRMGIFISGIRVIRGYPRFLKYRTKSAAARNGRPPSLKFTILGRVAIPGDRLAEPLPSGRWTFIVSEYYGWRGPVAGNLLV
jgi:hypothetical protein